MCDDKEEKDMLETLFKSNKNKSTPQNTRIANESIEKLLKDKVKIYCKDGVAKIDPSHPEYQFWTED